MKPIFDTLPPDVVRAAAALEKAVADRAQLTALQREAAAAEPEAVRAAGQAADALEAAEVELTLATDENFRALTQDRDRARAALDEAHADLETIRRRQRGLAAKMHDVNSAVEAAYTEWNQIGFRRELEHRYRQYRAAAAASFVRALRLGWMIENIFPRSLGSVLREAKIRDFGPLPGRPMPCLIEADKAWLDEDDQRGTDLRLFDESDPEFKALNALLKPIGGIENRAQSEIARIGQERAREAARQPVQPRPKSRSAEDTENARLQAMTDAEYRAYRAEKINAERGGPAPVRHTFSQGNIGRLTG